MHFTFDLHEDYKAQFRDYVNWLFDTKLETPQEYRLSLSVKLTSSYYTVVQERPDSAQLSRLASFILVEDKVTE